MPREESAQIFTRLAALVEPGEQPLDSIRNLGSGAAVANRPRDRRKLPDASANAEVIRIHHAAIHFDFFALDADISDPMLPATIRAAGDIEPQLLLEIGEALFKLLRKPSRKALRLGKRELAKLRTRAGHGSTREDRGLHREGSNTKFVRHRGRVALWHVDDQQVLHGCGSNVSVGVAIGQIRGSAQLLRSDASSQYGSANVDKTTLLLRVNADVVTVNIHGNIFRFGGIKRKSNLSLQLIQKAVGRPALLQKQKL